MRKDMIRFNKPYISGKEIEYINEVIASGRLAGGNDFTKLCENFLEKFNGSEKVLLTHSCTAALEMSAILMDVKKGDEIIMPSYTFVSTANAFVLRGAVPVFVDIDKKNFCIDDQKIKNAITDKTVGIVPVHYGGLSANMDNISKIAKDFNLFVIEDAAQSLGCKYNEKNLGTIGALSTLSFHETKNLNCGEGGALCINDTSLIERAEIIREKGTNRSKFFRGHIDKYTWVDIGSSYIPSELNAAFLYAQLNNLDKAFTSRKSIWNLYKERLEPINSFSIPESFLSGIHNCHIFPILTENLDERTNLLEFLASRNIGAVFHYVPLHNTVAGIKYGKASEDLSVTNDLSERLIRLPIYSDMEQKDAEVVIESIIEFYA